MKMKNNKNLSLRSVRIVKINNKLLTFSRVGTSLGTITTTVGIKPMLSGLDI